MIGAESFSSVPNLVRTLLTLLSQIPPGRVATCGDLAEALGNRIAARWVGHYALHHEHDAGCPCHRVVRLGGKLGGYAAGSLQAKARKLKAEGVEVHQGVIDLEEFAFGDFQSNRPLERLRRIQEEVQRQIILRSRRRMPKLVGGVDVAYPRPGVGVAAYVLVNVATSELVWSTSVCRPVGFPYVSTYLSFREIPIYLDLLDMVRKAGRMAEVLLVDGSGIIHHRHAGIASHLGVVAGVPTIGVTKKLLCGQVDIKHMSPGESRPVIYEDQLIGIALRATAGSLRPLYVSPGHRVNVAFCEQLVRQLLTGRRLPEPIYRADRLSRKLEPASD